MPKAPSFTVPLISSPLTWAENSSLMGMGDVTLAAHGASLLLAATCPCLPPAHDAPGIVLGRQTGRWVEMTLPMNMTRMPAATVAAGLGTDEAGFALPVGLQVLGGQQQDAAVLAGALAFERCLGGPLRADLATLTP